MQRTLIMCRLQTFVPDIDSQVLHGYVTLYALYMYKIFTTSIGVGKHISQLVSFIHIIPLLYGFICSELFCNGTLFVTFSLCLIKTQISHHELLTIKFQFLDVGGGRLNLMHTI